MTSPDWPIFKLKDASCITHNGIRFETTRDEKHRPTTVRLSMGDAEVVLPHFAPYTGLSGQNRPYVYDIVELEKLVCVIGYQWLVVFNRVDNSLASVVRLNREIDQDSGWFDHDFVLVGNTGTTIVYESGALRLRPNGALRWHIHKMWDDVLVSATSDELYFSSGDESSFWLSISDGSRQIR